MAPETYRTALGRLRDAGVDQVRLLGGEPTLHERFPEYVQDALDAGFRVLVFSNGLMPEQTARYLATRSGQVVVLVNASDPNGTSEEQLELQARTLAILGCHAYLGCTLSGSGATLGFLLDLVDRYDLGRTIRLGLAQPRIDGDGFSMVPSRLAAVGLRIAEFAGAAAARAVRVEFDCGMVPCMFPPEFLNSSLCDTQRLGTACGPIPDILPDGTAIACYPLASLARIEMERYTDLGAIRQALSDAIRPWRDVGILPECAPCRWRQAGRCLGGCVALAMRRAHAVSPPPPQARPVMLPGVERDTEPPQRPAARLVIPYVDQPLEFWNRLADEFGPAVAEVYFPLPRSPIGSGRPPQPEAHLEDFLRHSPFPLGVLLNPIVLPRPLEVVADEILEALRRLDGDHGLKSITVTNLQLASRIRRELPHCQVVASVLMDIERPNQALMLSGICDVLVPSGRVLRDRAALSELRRAFAGRIRLMVNEGCLPGCPLRIQHFFEMATEQAHPRSLCAELLAEHPWMRLTGAWILPQHLCHYDDLYDELKLAGRVTLRDPARYRRVLAAYASCTPMAPHEIGAGPAGPLEPIEIDTEFVARASRCGLRCDACTFCERYYAAAHNGQ